MKILDGKKTATVIKQELANTVTHIKKSGGKIPHLAAVIVGKNGASRTYVNAKVKACEVVGFESTLVELPEETSQKELLQVIQRLNKEVQIDGFIVQLPLPKHIDEQAVLMAVSPEKDVDGFHPVNVGKMALELPCFLPATPYGILELLMRYGVSTSGKEVVVIGRSHIVGRPISILMSQRHHQVGDATVTLLHSRSKDLESFTKRADIVIVALGKPLFLKADMVKEGVVVIDVGITRVDDATKKSGFKLLGDVDYESVAKKSSCITPVPGGVGPMTIAMLLKNTLKASQRVT